MQRGGKTILRERSVLADGRELDKVHPVFEALGTIDEFQAHLALILSESGLASRDRDLIEESLDACSGIAGFLAGAGPDTKLKERLQRLQSASDWLFDSRGDSFVRFTASPLAARIDLARAVCRRAERRVLALKNEIEIDIACIYLDTLSDWLFLLSRSLAPGDK